MGTRRIYHGLLPHVKKFLKDKHYAYNLDFDVGGVPFDERIALSFIKNFENQKRDGEIISVRLEQFSAYIKAIQGRRRVIVSPTGSGKSLIIYLITQYLLEIEGKKRGLIIVPRTSLVEQLYSDFGQYGSNLAYHRLYEGRNKTTEKPVTITTWQSIVNMPSDFFGGIDFCVVDECHMADGKSVSSILSKCVDTSFRIGLSGTLEETKIHKLVLQGLFGPIVQVAKTHELIKKKQLSPLQIQCMVLQYDDDTRAALRRKSYVDEINFLVSSEKRNKYIANLIASLPGNSLVLCGLVDRHLLLLRDVVAATTRKELHVVHGKVPVEEREEIRRIAERSNNAVILATYGTFQTGINIKRLHNIIFASPSKSKIRVLQSIGRGLRLHGLKEVCNVFDLVDDLRIGKWVNYVLSHFLERIKIYNIEKFNYKTFNIKL